MAIPSKEVPFSCDWITDVNRKKEEKVAFYATSKEELYNRASEKNYTVEMVENRPLAIRFQSTQPGLRFYMDGLSSLPASIILEDNDGEAYLVSNSTEVFLFENTKEYYPFVPGYYLVEVRGVEQSYFMWLRIRPKQVNEEQWTQMRKDIERQIAGLAQDLIKQNRSRSTAELIGLPRTLIQQFQVIERHFSTLQLMLQELQLAPQFRIEKRYTWKHESFSRAIDEVSIKSLQQYPDKRPLMRSPHRFVNYDIKENRTLKHNIQTMVTALNMLIKAIDDLPLNQPFLPTTNTFARREEQITEKLLAYQQKAKIMRAVFARFMQTEWYSTVISKQAKPSSKEFADNRYRIFHKIVKEMQNQETSIDFHKSFIVQWRRSDKLYEIWGFLQLAQLLQHEEIGLTSVGGWLDEIETDNGKELIPDLPRGAVIHFEREMIKANLVYDAQLPASDDATDRWHAPLWTEGSHHSPDVRLDMYYDGTFVGSLIIDFKYRPRRGVWDSSKTSEYLKSQSMKQLISYSNDIKSPYLLDNSTKPESILKSINSIYEVWALFPEKQPKGYNQLLNGRMIRLLELSPLFDNAHLKQQLQHTITSMIERAQHNM